MKILQFLAGIILATSLFISGCKPKDSDIQSSVNEKLKANSQTAAVVVSVQDAVVTLSGELANDVAKSESEKIAASVKGVKSVVNNISVTAPAPPVVAAPPPVINPDDMLTSSVKDAIKDFPGVTATVEGGVVTLNGEVSKDDQRKIMMSVNSLKPKKVQNKLTIKK